MVVRDQKDLRMVIDQEEMREQEVILIDQQVALPQEHIVIEHQEFKEPEKEDHMAIDQPEVLLQEEEASAQDAMLHEPIEVLVTVSEDMMLTQCASKGITVSLSS